ncbi:MAG: sugar ABC transporter permease [Pseudomonadota bacterium]
MAARSVEAVALRWSGWRREEIGAILFALPSWLLILTVFLLPSLVTLYLSVRNEQIGSFFPPEFVGLENFYTELSNPVFWEAFGTTFLIMGMGLAVQMPIGLGLAMLLHRRLLGTRLFRSTLLIPMLLTPVAIGLMWRFMFDTDLGVINWLLQAIGVERVNWLGSRWGALWAVTIVDSWQSIPFVMLMLLAGLSGLSREPQEAAWIDGANWWQSLIHVTLPMLRPVLLVVLTIRIIDIFKIFDVIFILTQRGGPGTATQTLGLLTYNTGFIFLATSRAAALGVVLVIMCLPIYVLWRKAAEGSR